MNIKREFLYNEEKYIPLQLLTSVYGVAESNPDATFISGDSSVHITEILFPPESSNLVFLLDFGTKDIVQVYASPPGELTVNLEIKRGKSYSVYVVSKEYVDGFINGRFEVDPNTFSAIQMELDYDSNPPQRIDLTIDGAMIKSKGRDFHDSKQWYGYDGYYDGPLKWSVQTLIDGTELDSKNYWLVIQKEIFAQLDNIFRKNDLTSYTTNKKNDPIKMYKIMDEIGEFMRDKRATYDDLLGEDADKINHIWEFLNSSLPGFNVQEQSGSDYYLTFTEPIGDWLDELGVYSDYILWDKLSARGYPNADIAGQFVAATNEGKDNPITYTDDEGTSMSYNTIMNDSERYTGQYAGGLSARNIIRGLWSGQNWVATKHGGSAGHFDSNFAPTWNKFIIEKTSFIEDTNSTLNLKYNFPLRQYTGNITNINLDWWNEIGEIGKGVFDNINGWIVDKTLETINLISQVGDSAFCCPNDQNSVKNFPTDYNWEIKPQTPNGVDENQWDTFWQEIITFSSYIGYSNIPIPDPISPYKGFEQYNNKIDFNNLWYAYYVWYTDLLSENTVLNDECLPCPNSISGETVSENRDYLPQSQEGILQNIRFLRDLINSMDENMWSSITNSNALMLSTILDIRKELNNRPETHSILNVTSSTVKPENIEIIWKKISPYPTGLNRAIGWKQQNILKSKIINVGNNLMVVDINGDEFKDIGKYIFIVQPQKLYYDILRVEGEYAIVYDEANDFKTSNAFYGYNAQLYSPDGELQGGQKVIIESKWRASEQWLKISPLTQSLDTLSANLKIEMWSNEFIPATIEVDIVEHNALTLSYAAYAKKELNTSTGLCVIYDHNGNAYKELSFGKHSNQATGGAIIEYRTPIDDTDGY